MTNARLDELLYTLDLCADYLPFDLMPVHIERLRTIKAILTEKASRPKATILQLKQRRPEQHKQKD